MVKAVRVHTVGGRHHLQLEEVELPRPGCDEVEVRHRAIGLNSTDVEDCRGLHHPSHAIFTPGRSAVGVITELGTGVLNHQIGQRVGYVNPPNNRGAFSEAAILPTSCLVPLPASISDEEAAAVLFPGLTAWMLLKKLCPLRRGDAVLVSGVASGLGSILAQWAKHLNAVVIGAVRSEGDVERAQEHGCGHVVVVDQPELAGLGFADAVRELTSGEGVALAVDLLGTTTSVHVVHCLAPKGTLVTGLGAAPSLSFKDLAGGHSLVVAVPVLADYVKHPAELAEGAQFLFELYKAGAIKVEIAKKFPLSMINKALDAAVQGEAGLCILIPPVPDPKNVPQGS